jgi:hypothetical protein
MQQAEPGCLCSSDREGHTYLSGWLAVLLSVGGRLIIIINSVFDTLPTYTMAAMVLLPLVIKALDALRHAFLWATADRVFGA